MEEPGRGLRAASGAQQPRGRILYRLWRYMGRSRLLLVLRVVPRRRGGRAGPVHAVEIEIPGQDGLVLLLLLAGLVSGPAV